MNKQVSFFVQSTENRKLNLQRLSQTEDWSREELPKTAKALSSSMCVPPFYQQFQPVCCAYGCRA
jgi:hypothetical protein